jgi:hypothetical protein
MKITRLADGGELHEFEGRFVIAVLELNVGFVVSLTYLPVETREAAEAIADDLAAMLEGGGATLHTGAAHPSNKNAGHA